MGIRVPVCEKFACHWCDDVLDDATLRAQSGGAYRRCFCCGSDNPIGLRLRFRQAVDGARAEFQPRPEHQGWDDSLHGGILLTLLDETLAYAALFKVGPAVTAEISARIRRPAPLDRQYLLHGEVNKVRLGLVKAHATISDADGRLYAEADGKFMVKR
jgi:acyl-coenzyme A thioesterase PaaI-like protein